MSISVDVEKTKKSTPSTDYDIVVLGAGPYGLSVTTHLRGQGLKVAVFGRPICFWRENMPQGMLLRSYWWATNLSDPQQQYDFVHYFKEKGIQPKLAPDPLPIEMFIDYALWFQKHAVPDVDETYIKNIVRQETHFVVTLEDDRVVTSKAVVMAPGLHYYLYIPDEYKVLPAELVSHSADIADPSKFRGQKVAVIGGGQGSLETAALIQEAGADTQVIVRRALRWVKVGSGKLPPFLQSLRSPKAGMGSGWVNLLLEKFPYTLQRMSQSYIDEHVDGSHGPAGSQWLKPRLFGKVTIHEHTKIEKIEAVDKQARLTLSDGNIVEVDHVILGTGYRPDVQRLYMLDESLRNEVRSYRGSPVLNNVFETSVPGLYFVGFSTARSFGPFFRFVVGAGAAARRIARAASAYVANQS
jgi:thioredoxin reductase